MNTPNPRLTIFLLLAFLAFQCSSNGDGLNDPIIDEPCNIDLTLNTNSWAPLAGMAGFSTREESKIRVRVLANQENGQEIEREFDDFRTEHEIPVLGLYPDFNNRVEITKMNRQGDGFRQTCTLQTNAKPSDIPELTVITNNIPANESRLYFVGGHGADFIFDKRGAVRWYLGHAQGAANEAEKTALIYNQLSDGVLAVGIERHVVPYWFTKMAEMDFLGEIKTTYELPDYLHHSVEELPGGKLMLAGSKPGTRGEDVVYQFDRATASLTDTFDFNILLDRGNSGIPMSRLAISRGNPDDWAHINAVTYDSSDDTIIFSLYKQSALIKVASDAQLMRKDIRWILGYPIEWGSLNSKNLLSGHAPERDWSDWPYGQHSVQALGDGSLLVFSNGPNRGLLQTSLPLVSGGGDISHTNRVIEYKVTGQSVSKQWEFEAPDPAYNSPVLGSVRQMENGNRLILFPQPLPARGLPTTVMEVDRDKNVVFQANFPPDHPRGTFHARAFSFVVE